MGQYDVRFIITWWEIEKRRKEDEIRVCIFSNFTHIHKAEKRRSKRDEKPFAAQQKREHKSLVCAVIQGDVSSCLCAADCIEPQTILIIYFINIVSRGPSDQAGQFIISTDGVRNLLIDPVIPFTQLVRTLLKAFITWTLYAVVDKVSAKWRWL